MKTFVKSQIILETIRKQKIQLSICMLLSETKLFIGLKHMSRKQLTSLSKNESF